MNIAVCLKQTLDPEIPQKDFKIDPGSKKPLQGKAKFVMDSYAENALELAIKLKEAYGASVTVFSVGAASFDEVLKRGLAFTADAAVRVWDDSYADLDAKALATVLGAAIRQTGEFDLILTGRQAADVERGSVGPMLSEYLHYSSVTFVAQVDALSATQATVRREGADGVEIIECKLPAVFSVTSHETNIPRLPKVKDTMQAMRKPVAQVAGSGLGVAAGELAAGIVTQDVFVPTLESKCEYIAGEDGAEKAAVLAKRLRELKLV